MMSDEEPPSKIVKIGLEPESLEAIEGEDGQEEWLSEGLLTDDDYNPSADQNKSDSIQNTSQESQQSVDQNEQEAPTENIEQKLNSFENSQNGIELPDDLDSFLIKKQDKVNESDIDESVKQSDEDDDGHNTDDLLRMLGEDEGKKVEGHEPNDQQKVMQLDNSTDDDDEYIFEGAKVTQLKVAKSVLMRKYPATKAVPEDMSDSDMDDTSNESRPFNRAFSRSFQSSEDANVVKKMFGVKKPLNVAAKSTARSSLLRGKGGIGKNVTVGMVQKPTLSSGTTFRQYVNKNRLNKTLSDDKQQQQKSISKQTEEADEIINEEEFLEDDEFDLDEEFAEESDTQLDSRKQHQRIMKPEEMDEEVPSDGESHSEDGSLYDDLPSTDSEEIEDWFTFDIRAERAGEYLPLLGSNATQLLTAEKHRVMDRLDQLRQSLSALTDSGREQAEQLRKVKTSLTEIDAMLAAS